MFVFADYTAGNNFSFLLWFSLSLFIPSGSCFSMLFSTTIQLYIEATTKVISYRDGLIGAIVCIFRLGSRNHAAPILRYFPWLFFFSFLLSFSFFSTTVHLHQMPDATATIFTYRDWLISEIVHDCALYAGMVRHNLFLCPDSLLLCFSITLCTSIQRL